MEIMSFIKLFGGLAIFIYGMTVMGGGLERIAGSKLEKTLEKVAGNIWKAISMGLLVTLVIQSSSATTVMVIGFVNAGIMTLGQSVGIILGANIGTTITAQIIRLDSTGSYSSNFFLQILKPSNFAYIAVLIGVLLLVTAKTKTKRDVSSIFVGFGVLFIGMSTMETAVSPLKDVPEFQNLFMMFENPLLGVAVGALVTAVIQSSSASVGILQALSTTGMITFSSAIPIILGQNIGTCITAVLSSFNANKNAKRAACIHFYFNFIGTFVFLAAVYAVQYTIGFDFWYENIDKAGIANFHTVFNVITVLMFIPLNKLLVKAAEKTIPYEEVAETPLSRLDVRFYKTPELALEQCQHCITEMGHTAHKSFNIATKSFFDGGKTTDIISVNDNEKFLDIAEVEISKYLLGISGLSLPSSKMKHMEMLRSIDDFETVGDYSKNIAEIVVEMTEKKVPLSGVALDEIRTMTLAVNELIELTCHAYASRDLATARKVEPLEDVIDSLREQLKTNHLLRLSQSGCTIDNGHYFLEIIRNLEKVADHCSNIAIYIIQQQDGSDGFNTHSYVISRTKDTEEFINLFNQYELKYLHSVKR